MALHTMRQLEHWRNAFGTLDRAIVILAVTSITAERLTRGDLGNDLRDLRAVMPQEALGKCNISSIAAAAGINRETARRRVNELVADGFLIREGDGSVAFSSTFGGQAWVLELVQKQLFTVVKTINDLASDGAVQTS
jgi:predicted transcriptional regulator